MGNGLLQSIADNVVFVLVCVGVAVGLFAIAYAAEKYVYKRDGITERILSTRKITMIGLFSALAMILHIFDFPVLFLAPGFYKLDFSEIPALVGAFAFGPVAGVMIEFCKILLKLVVKGTSTAFVGDLANFVIGCSLVLPASIIYMFKKTRKIAVIACLAGSLVMTVFGTAYICCRPFPSCSVCPLTPSLRPERRSTEISTTSPALYVSRWHRSISLRVRRPLWLHWLSISL